MEKEIKGMGPVWGKTKIARGKNGGQNVGLRVSRLDA